MRKYLDGPEAYFKALNPFIKGGIRADIVAAACRACANLLAIATKVNWHLDWVAGLRTSGILGSLSSNALSQENAQVQAARAIFYASYNVEIRDVLRENGTVSRIIDVMTAPSDSLQRWTIATLRMLAENDWPTAKSILEQGGVFMLCSLLSSQDDDVVGQVLATLSTSILSCQRASVTDAEEASNVMTLIVDSIAESDGLSNATTIIETKSGDSVVVALDLLEVISGFPSAAASLR